MTLAPVDQVRPSTWFEPSTFSMSAPITSPLRVAPAAVSVERSIATPSVLEA